MNIVIIGTGNVAYALTGKLVHSNHQLIQVAGRNAASAEKIGQRFSVPFSSDITFINRTADLYIVAINDDALSSIGEWLHLDKKLVVHTAGSVSKDVLKQVSRNYGVLYPLQSLKAEMETLPEIPFLVDGNTPDDLALIYDFACSLSKIVEVASDEQRMKLHLAAVVVNNFTNHLYALAEQYCLDEKLDFNLLQPLIRETANRVGQLTPNDLQTGPAIREDHSTIAKQMQLLEAHPHLRTIYREMTRSIQELYNRKKPGNSFE